MSESASRPVQEASPSGTLDALWQKLLPAGVTAERFAAQKRFSNLDGLRCISIVGVVWFHIVRPQPDWPNLWRRGYTGVDLFFVISGFLITTLLLRERDSTGTIALGKFYMRRSLRIMPLYFGVLLLYLIKSLRYSEQVAAQNFLHNFPYFLTYTSNIFVHRTGEPIPFFFAWSLAAEEQFYLFWPFVLRFAPNLVSRLFIPAMLMFSIAIDEHYFIAHGTEAATLWYRMPVPICFGVLIAQLLHDRRTFSVLAFLTGRRYSALFWLTLALAALSLKAPTMWFFRVPFTMLVCSCVIREDGVLAPLLQLRPFVYIGTVSYGIYLLHFSAQNVVTAVSGFVGVKTGMLEFPLVMGMSVVLAGLSFRYFERWFLKTKSRYAVTAG